MAPRHATSHIVDDHNIRERQFLQDELQREKNAKNQIEDELHRWKSRVAEMEKEIRDIEYTHQQKQAQNEDKQRLLERDIIGVQTELKEENERRVRKEHEAEEVKRANYYQQQRTAEDIKGL